MSDQHSFKQSLSLFDGVMVVAGSMIGSGIFIVSADMTRQVGSAGWLIALWVLTGVMTIFAAVSYGELSSMYPKAGGQYVYLKEAYNPLVGFLYGWSFFSVIQTGTIAAVGVAFSKFAGYFIPALTIEDNNLLFQLGWLKIYPAQLVSIALIIFLTYINTRGVKEGKIVQTSFTIIKLLSILGLILAGLFFAFNQDTWRANWATGFDLKFTRPVFDGAAQTGWALFGSSPTLLFSIGLISSALVGSVFSSVAWENVTFIAGEIKNPKRNVGLSLLLGTVVVTIVYVLMNLMYVAVMPLFPQASDAAAAFTTEFSQYPNVAFPKQDRVATAAAFNIFGVYGTAIIAVMIMISTFGCNNGLILSGARVFQAMAQDKLFLPKARHLNKNSVPQWALWLQCIWAAILCLSGQYGLLLDYVVFITIVFYVLTIIGVFVLRKKRPLAERPYKTFGYPVIPALYIIVALVMCIGLLYAKTSTSLFGLIIVCLGIPVYYYYKARHQVQE